MREGPEAGGAGAPELVLMPLTYNGRELLEFCLPSMLAEAGRSPVPAEVWVVDNASTDGSRELVASRFPGVRWLGFPDNRILAAYNEALRRCPAPYVFLLNNDMRLEPGCLAALLARLRSDARFLAVSPAVEADAPADACLRRRGGEFRHGHLAPVDLPAGPGGTLYLHGGASLVRRERVLELGGFDPLFFYLEDNDLSWRAWRRGWPSVFEPAARVFHLGSRTTVREHGSERKRAFKEKASNLFVLKHMQDPAHLADFLAWTCAKTLAMVLRLDRRRAWAWKETLRLLPRVLAARRREPRLPDRTVLERIRSLVLEELPA